MVMFLVCMLLIGAIGNVVAGPFQDNRRQLDASESGRTPTNVWLEAGEDNITVHWTPPADPAGAQFCVVAFSDDNNALTIGVPVAGDQRVYEISGLSRDTLYKLRLNCIYESGDGPWTDWFRAKTRTVGPTVCPGSIPNAALEPYCLENPNYGSCTFTCKEGYLISDVPVVIRGQRSKSEDIDIWVFCVNGSWVTYNEYKGYGIQDLCLPEGEFQKCPTAISNIQLEPHCGPATDWLCRFDCISGYYKHPYMSGLLKGLQDGSNLYMLYCDNGVWRTGFEDLGVDISNVCFGEDHNCTDEIPHGTVHMPCPSGYYCWFECEEGYRKHALVWEEPFCMDGEWILRSSKYDPTLTPQNLCIPEDASMNCPRDIPHGRVTRKFYSPSSDGQSDENCLVDCMPDCDAGYHIAEDVGLSMGPGPVTCENGKWLTVDAAYTGDNICFPEGGHSCPYNIPNGISSHLSYARVDVGSGRLHLGYQCNEGFRKHRSIPQIECVAGSWRTWQERFGLNLSSLCIPFSRV